MYSGTTLRPLTGRIIGAHQKIDRLARKGLARYLVDNNAFPHQRQIVHFEGLNGPDAIKRKSPAKDEPWHYYTPFDESDTRLISIVSNHYDELVAALKKGDKVRAAFEASWLAHAIVDGLTPAHHYPYEQKLAQLRGGRGLETRTTLKQKIIMPGKTMREMLKNNWKMWAPKGLLNMHGTFEWGVAVMIAPLSAKRVALSKKDLLDVHQHGVIGLFKRKAKEIHVLKVYERYEKHGWNPALARVVRKQVVPVIISMVTLAWYAAALDAGVAERRTA